MMDYIVILLFYYLCILLLQLPWWLTLLAAMRRLRRKGGRLRRLQAEGAALIAAGYFAKWMVYDINFGPDRLEITAWSPWFSRAETGLLLIGLLLLGLGFFLERRPRPGMTPWPATVKNVCIAGILSGLVLATVAWILSAYAWLGLPYSLARVVFTLGCYPFCLGYYMWSKGWWR